MLRVVCNAKRIEIMKVYFSHGKESGPWGSKIQRLASIASEHGCTVDSIDYTDLMDPRKGARKGAGYVLQKRGRIRFDPRNQKRGRIRFEERPVTVKGL